MAIEAGRCVEWARTFSVEDVRAFAELSGDKGAQHLAPDAKGRLMVHGLLTATLPTKLGGDMDYIAGDMHFDFVRPVYAGETLTCVGVVESVERQPKRDLVTFSFTVTNGAGKAVLRGTSSGAICAR